MSRCERRAGNNGDDGVIQPGFSDIAAKLPKGINTVCAVIVQIGVVEYFAGLVLLRAAMMVQCEDGAALILGRKPKVDSGFATIAAHFQHGAQWQALAGIVIEGLSLIFGEEALDGVDISG